MKKVLIVHPEGNSFNNPTLKSMIDLLLDNGVDLSITYRLGAAPMPAYRGIHYIPWGKYWGRLRTIAFEKLSSKVMSFFIVLLEYLIKLKKFDLVIGVDRQGLIQATYLSRLSKKPCVFISFEILFESETSARYKRIERDASLAMTCWFVQDKERAKILRNENGFSERNCIILPLASKGRGVLSGDRLRDRLGIHKEQKVAIMIGSMGTWTMTREILDTIESWPEEWCVIIHDRYGQTSDYVNVNLASFQRHIGARIFVSDFSADKIDDLGFILSGIDVGLAFYRPDYSSPYLGKNIETIGMASGKISTFLRYGIPIITNVIGPYSRLSEQYGFGLCIDKVESLGSSLNELNFSSAGVAATKFFLEHLDFANYQDRVWKELCDAANGRSVCV